jgi:hypothetical protein
MWVLLLASSAGATRASWPQWRGPSGQGTSDEKNLPTEWSATKNIKWKTPIAGRGHSSPIVWGNRIFLTTAIQGEVVPGAKAVKHMYPEGEFLHRTASAPITNTPSRLFVLIVKQAKFFGNGLLSRARPTTTGIARAPLPPLRPPLTASMFMLTSARKVSMPTT